jgi:hypothetical protein
MHARVPSILLLLAAAACSPSEATRDGVATDEGIAAIALPEEQLREMLKRTFLGTQSGPMHLYALGMDNGCEVLDDAVDATVERRLPEWRANLIKAYRDNVPADELARAVEESPPGARSMLQPRMSAIGTAMQRSSEQLLQSSSAEVLEATGAAAEQVDLSSVDQSQRERELASASASGEICGIGS